MTIAKFKFEIISVFVIIAVYFFLRTLFLDRLPIFTDEAIYVRWAQIASNDAAWRFISLTDGKQPLFIWISIIFMRIIDDPLLAVRSVSVMSGIFSMVGLFLLSLELFKKRSIAFISVVLYVFYPFAQVYDRMALYDSLLGAFMVWAIYFTVLLVRKVRLDIAYTLGFVIGGALLNKSSGIFSAYLMPIALILGDFKTLRDPRFLIKFALLALFAFAISQGLYSVLRLSPFFHIITEKNAIFVYPFSEWILRPLDFFHGNIKGLIEWVITYLTPSYIILILLAFVPVFKFWREKIFLIAYFILPFISLALFGKVIFPRFIFFMTLSLLPIAAFGFNFLFEKLAPKIDSKLRNLLFIILLGMFIIYPAKISLDFAINPSSAKIANADLRQYVTSWPAGWGVEESVEFFKEKAKNGKIFVATAGTFGLMPFSYEIYLVDNKNIQIEGFWPVKDIPSKDLLEKSKKMPVYVVFYQPCPSCKEPGDAPDLWPLQKVLKIEKNDARLTVYELIAK